VGGGPLLSGEAGDPQCVDGVGLGPLEIFLSEAAAAEGIDQAGRVAALHQVGEDVAPVMARGFHGDDDVVRPAE
jgi:hypothetical protein